MEREDTRAQIGSHLARETVLSRSADSLNWILVSMRPKQWLKNGFLFATLLFSKNIFDPAKTAISQVAFAVFCLASGAVYLLNDLVDMEQDRNHPRKQLRALASGALDPLTARCAFAIVLAASLLAGYLINVPFLLIVSAYLAVQIAYCTFVKEIIILDVFSIASGFFLRVAVHNKTVVTNPRKGGMLNRLAPVYARYGIEEKYNFRPEDVRWIEYKPKTRMRVLHEVYPEGIHIPEYFIGRNVIHLPTVKTHIYTTTTGARKNAFGGLLNTKRHYTHSVIHETLVDLLAIQQEIHTGIFAVMDGTLCGNGPGPRTMIPVEKDYILAGSDSVAIDAVAAKMMGFDPMSIPYIRLAHEDGLGTGRPQEIEIVGEDVSDVNFGFQVGHNFASRFGDALWFSPLKALQRLFFRTPAVYFFIFGSYFYHDFLWWPLKGKGAQRAHALNTEWGDLFKSYPTEHNPLADARVRPQEELLRT